VLWPDTFESILCLGYRNNPSLVRWNNQLTWSKL
jgi:hypothetical protein